jgi:hypothetical protein
MENESDEKERNSNSDNNEEEHMPLINNNIYRMDNMINNALNKRSLHGKLNIIFINRQM